MSPGRPGRAVPDIDTTGPGRPGPVPVSVGRPGVYGSPEEYREKWGLEPDYPMIAPNHSKKHSSITHETGLPNVRKTDGKTWHKNGDARRLQ